MENRFHLCVHRSLLNSIAGQGKGREADIVVVVVRLFCLLLCVNRREKQHYGFSFYILPTI